MLSGFDFLQNNPHILYLFMMKTTNSSKNLKGYTMLWVYMCFPRYLYTENGIFFPSLGHVCPKLGTRTSKVIFIYKNGSFLDYISQIVFIYTQGCKVIRPTIQFVLQYNSPCKTIRKATWHSLKSANQKAGGITTGLSSTNFHQIISIS